MEYLKQSCNSLLFWCRIFSKIFPDIIFKIVGNLFPLYLGAFILLIIDKSSIEKVLDAQNFIIYSSTFLFSTMYLWYKNIQSGGKNKRGLILMLLFFLLGILLSILYAFTLTKTNSNFDFKSWAVFLFIIIITLYIIFECYNYFLAENSDFNKSTNSEYEKLKMNFKDK
jgi:hypothetical protein